MDFQLPDFDIGDDDDDFVPAPTWHKNLHEDEEIMELVWQNGEIVAQIQKQNNPATMPLRQPPQTSQPASVDHLFIQEDEMAAWLHYSPNDRQLYPNLLPPSPQPPPQPLPHPRPPQPQQQLPPQPQQQPPSPPQPSSSLPSSTITIPESRPPIAPSARNFAHFSRVRVTDPRPPTSTVVESNETPAFPSEKRSPEIGGKVFDGASSAGGGERREVEACGDNVVSSAPGVAGASTTAAVEGKMKVPAADRKRKGREGGDLTAGCHAAVEDVDKESAEAKRIRHETADAKRSRSAEVHRLSERKRRDAINERMRTLQQLIPSCTKSDKASMLDEAIRYTNQLQMHVRMMSMGYGMPPIMFPGVQQYMPPTGMGMGMGMRMGMGMGMEATMGMSHPMMPFPHMLPGSGFPPPGSAPLLGPRFPLPTYPIPVIPAPGPSRAEASNQADPINTIGLQNSNMLHGLYVADPNYQRFLAMQQMQGQPSQPQDQPSSVPCSSKPSKTRDSEGQ